MLEHLFGTLIVVATPLEYGLRGALEIHLSLLKVAVCKFEPILIGWSDRVPHRRNKSYMWIESLSANSLENFKNGGGGALHSYFGNFMEIDGPVNCVPVESCEGLGDLFEVSEVFIRRLHKSGGIDDEEGFRVPIDSRLDLVGLALSRAYVRD